jgi:hypothetical protein
LDEAGGRKKTFATGIFAAKTFLLPIENSKRVRIFEFYLKILISGFLWNFNFTIGGPQHCRSGGIGRRARFRGVWEQSRAGSSPAFGTLRLVTNWVASLFYCGYKF